MTTVQPVGLKDMRQKWIFGDKAEFFGVCFSVMCIDNGHRPRVYLLIN